MVQWHKLAASRSVHKLHPRWTRLRGVTGEKFTMRMRKAEGSKFRFSNVAIYSSIYWRLSTAQGHIRAFHKFKSRTSWIQYKTLCTLHQRKSKTYKHNTKVGPFGIALVKKWQIKLGDGRCWVIPLTVSVWCFNTRLNNFKFFGKKSKNNCYLLMKKSKILYIKIKG